ncbi:MAG: hypothetical protein MR346_02835 [Clostridium sp.]|nr:hypothetical protein [Clostridium sp.]
MRNLQFGDMFAAARLIKTIGLKEELRKITAKTISKESSEDVSIDLGVDLLLGIFERACEKNCEEKVYEFLKGPFECEAEDVKKMDPFELIENIKQVADINKWKDFFKKASQLMK